jgi:hypothetical protein
MLTISIRKRTVLALALLFAHDSVSEFQERRFEGFNHVDDWVPQLLGHRNRAEPASPVT